MITSKNIHVLPTDKPSRLHFDGKLFLSPNYQDSKTINSIVEGRNIYITNSEEIKEGDYVYSTSQDYNIQKVSKELVKSYQEVEHYKKIILTTDQDLIKDGVRKIDNDFLEWFVDNPTCEFIEVETEAMFKGYMTFPESINEPPFYGNLKHKIIIPKEEVKNPNNQEVMFHEEHKEYFYEDFVNGKLVTVWLGKDYIPKEEPKQETLEQIDQTNPVTKGSTALVYKQETLEEYNKKSFGEIWSTLTNEQSEYLKDYINRQREDAKKWQQEKENTANDILNYILTNDDGVGIALGYNSREMIEQHFKNIGYDR